MPWVKVAKTSEVADGEIKPFDLENRKIAITRVGREFFAIDDTCTHAQCSLGEGSLIDYEVECPCHGSRFDVTDGSVRILPATVPIKTYKLKVEGDDILVEITENA
ncbi:MAG TPA: non-heme iron oxygenase ferredoxin subunit [candidate division WWE3 bacterium]|uniref:Non-heme iron oxygenase ferredoxin subunit n=1 Tax=candidate division WWE3 bacterium TaxID=2053526 RepID=A0A7C1NMY7_UNCKA|nr:non-heme iron oxygenase ferredoxin subunit [candidate division WWE3 bacterium]